MVTLDAEDRLSFVARTPNLDRDLNVFSPDELRVGLVTGLPANLYNLESTDINVTKYLILPRRVGRLLQFKRSLCTFLMEAAPKLKQI